MTQELSTDDQVALATHRLALKTSAQDAQIIDVLLLGLQTDGSHHKQWALWRIAEILGVDHFLNEIEDKGIAP